MYKYSIVAAAMVAGAAACIGAPAAAHSDGGWSVTIESQPQPYTPPPPVFYPQAPFPYGPPPSAFAPPPQPGFQYRYQEPWPGQQYRDRDRDWRDRDDRRDRDGDRDRGRDNDRPGPGERHDLPKWGYGGRHR